DGADESEFSRVRSSHQFDILDALPHSHVQFAGVQRAWQKTWIEWVAAGVREGVDPKPLPVPPYPPCPVDSWVVLAGGRLGHSVRAFEIEAIDFAPRRVLWPSWAIQSALLTAGLAQ